MSASKPSTRARLVSDESSNRAAPLDTPHQIRFRLPLEGFPLAVFQGNYGYDHGALIIGSTFRRTVDRPELRSGVIADYAGHAIELRLDSAREGDERLLLSVNGAPALREDELTVPSARSTWIHGCIGLAASAAGFAAGYLYLHKAAIMGNAWASKMGYHTAAWHALLVISLFPASVWGQRIGIRGVQVVSFVFLLIHLGIAVANAAWPDAGSSSDIWIAALNALSGLLFLASVVYGQRAYRDMDPIAGWRARLAGAP